MAVLGTEGRGSFSCPKTKTDGSPKVTCHHIPSLTVRSVMLQTPVLLSLNYFPWIMTEFVDPSLLPLKSLTQGTSSLLQGW